MPELRRSVIDLFQDFGDISFKLVYFLTERHSSSLDLILVDRLF